MVRSGSGIDRAAGATVKTAQGVWLPVGIDVGALLAVILRVESDIGFIPLFFRPFVHLLAQAAGVVPLLFSIDAC